MALFRSLLLSRLLVGSVLLGLMGGLVGTVAQAAPTHPRTVWQRALADATVTQALQDAARAIAEDPAETDAQAEAFLAALAAMPGGDRLVAYLGAVADPADVLRALLGTSQMGAAVPLGFADTWLAPAPPTTTTPGARAFGTPANLPALSHAPQSHGYHATPDLPGVPDHRDRFPAVQPLGP